MPDELTAGLDVAWFGWWTAGAGVVIFADSALLAMRHRRRARDG